MNCFYHPDQPALGMCKHCQRGLCGDCAAVVDDVLACKGHHEEEVRKGEQLTARNLFQSKRAGSGYLRNAVFYGLVGGVFAAFGLWQLKWLGLQAGVFILLGIFLLYAAGANFFEGRKYN
jgi:asparagine N-glycosylation enzyme membrane subunit Stt3